MKLSRLSRAVWLLPLALACSKDEGADCSSACPAPGFCQGDQCLQPGTEVLAGAVGTEPEQFGIVDAQEAESEGPRSIAASDDGSRVYVLDQVNQRVDVYSGSTLAGSLPIPTTTAHELATLPEDRLVVMDRYQDRFSVLDADGDVIRNVSISGDGVVGPEYAGRLYSRADGIWMESGPLFVGVLDAEGREVEERRMLPGLPSPDGQWLLSIELLGDGSLHVVVRPARGPATYKQTQLSFQRRISHVLAYDMDSEGRVYIGTEHVWSEGDTLVSGPRLTVLSPDLTELRQHELPPELTARTVSRSLAVTRGGAVFRLQVDTDRVAVLRY